MTVRIFDDEDLAMVKEVLDSGDLCSIGGKMTPRFERAFAEEMKVKHAVAMNSAMSVLHAAVAAAGAGAGDEVICDPLVQFGAVAAMYNNAIPVFADVRRDTHLVDPESIKERITERTKAIICTHLWGLPCDMDPIMEIAAAHDLIVVEDIAHAIYATYKGRLTGSLGHIGSFSFQMGKQLGLGDAGMGTTNDDYLADRLADGSGTRGRATFPRVMWNYRINEVVSAIGLVQLTRTKQYVADGTANAELYNEAVKDTPLVQAQHVPPDRTNTYHIWAGTFEGDKHGIDYDEFKRAVSEEGCSVGFGYINVPAYLHDVIKEPLGYGRGCPTACPLHVGRVSYQRNLCPVAEDLMPRLMMAGTAGTRETHRENADKLRKAIERFG